MDSQTHTGKKSIDQTAREITARNEKRTKDREIQKSNEELNLKKDANRIARRTSFIAFGALIISAISLALSIYTLIGE